MSSDTQSGLPPDASAAHRSTASTDRHDHGNHHHGVTRSSDRRYLTMAAALLGAFIVVEVIVAISSGSLALLTDAGHMLTDLAALLLALVAIHLAARPRSGRYTFGWQRAEILSAQFNGITLLLLGAWFAFEGVRRLLDPPDVDGLPMLVVALVGVVVNLIATLMLSRANRSSLNVEGAFQHLLTDLYAFIGTAIAGLVIILTGYTRADPIAALIVAVLMLRSGGRLVLDSGRVLLEAAPPGIDAGAVEQAMLDDDDVVQVRDLHVWQVTSGFPALSAHIVVRAGADCHAVGQRLRQALETDQDITHSTLQVDHDSDARDTSSRCPAD